jgi:hypothetical protein
LQKSEAINVSVVHTVSNARVDAVERKTTQMTKNKQTRGDQKSGIARIYYTSA